MDPVIVVGAGISGIACAREVAAANLPVRVLDRGRRLGGRMASRTVNGRPVDTGASYFTVSDAAFEAVVSDWQRRGLARPWTDTFALLDGGPPVTKSGPLRWGAPRGLRSLVEDLAAGLEVRSEVTVSAVEVGRSLAIDGQPAAAVVLAMPDPQAARLLPDGSKVRRVVDRPYDPVLAVVAQWPERGWADGFDGAFVDRDPYVAWIADDGRRRGDDAPVLVAHSTTDFARGYLQQPEEAVRPLTDAVGRLLDLPDPPSTTLLQRWSYAKPAEPREQDYHLSEELLGVCGDGWAAKPRVEGAYLSGRRLGEALVARLC